LKTNRQKASGADDPAVSQSRQRIIEAATTLFVRDGYKATSVKAITKEVGITPPALYWHFENKQALFLASMEYLLDSFIDSVEGSLTETQPTRLLRQLVEAHVRWKLEQLEFAGAYTSAIGGRDIIHSLPVKHRQSLVAKQRRYLGRLRGILEHGIENGEFTVPDPRVTTFAIITLCEYVYSWYDPAGELSPADVADRYADLALGMVNAVEVSDPDVLGVGSGS
jgi:AcrR family transcriptional regulator